MHKCADRLELPFLYGFSAYKAVASAARASNTPPAQRAEEELNSAEETAALLSSPVGFSPSAGLLVVVVVVEVVVVTTQSLHVHVGGLTPPSKVPDPQTLLGSDGSAPDVQWLVQSAWSSVPVAEALAVWQSISTRRAANMAEKAIFLLHRNIILTESEIVIEQRNGREDFGKRQCVEKKEK